MEKRKRSRLQNQRSKRAEDSDNVLLKFCDSTKVYVREMKDIKVQNGRPLLKWCGATYEITILANHKNKSILTSLARNMNSGLPKILLAQSPPLVNTCESESGEYSCIPLVNAFHGTVETSTSISTSHIGKDVNTCESESGEYSCIPLVNAFHGTVETSTSISTSHIGKDVNTCESESGEYSCIPLVNAFHGTVETSTSNSTSHIGKDLPSTDNFNIHTIYNHEVDDRQLIGTGSSIENYSTNVQLNKSSPADSIAIHKNKSSLTSLARNMNSGLPKILLAQSPSPLVNTCESESGECSCIPLVNAFHGTVETSTSNSTSHIGKDLPSTDNFNIHTIYNHEVDDRQLIGTVSSIENCSTNDVQLNKSSPADGIEKKLKKRKQHCCLYCGLLTVSLPRHLMRKHKVEEKVTKALSFEKNSKEWHRTLNDIRKEGDFLYNKRSEKDIVVRNSNKPTQTTYLPCPFCSGYYSVKSLRHHVRETCLKNKKSKCNILGLSIVKGSYIHEKACEKLKTLIYPSIRDTSIFRVVTTDETAVLYGNRLANTYLTMSQHHAKMIAADLRLLGKLFLAIKNASPSVTEIKDIFSPKQYTTVVEVIRKLAGFDGEKYARPTIVHQSCILLKKVGDYVKCLMILREDNVCVKTVQKFLDLLRISQNSDLTKMATETRVRHQRIKVEILPTTSEIKELISFLEADIYKYYTSLKQCYDKDFYIYLSQLILLYIMVFNRKRPGDVQRTELAEYKTVATIANEDFENLSSKEKVHAVQFARYIARGKLNRSSSILLSCKVKSAIDLLLEYREMANVNKDNKYLFADPTRENSFYEANIALKKYCKSKGFADGKFTATKLRKHLATNTATLPKDTQTIISDFMGHGQEIHNNIYKHRDAYIDITVMGQVLTNASGFSNTPLHQAVPRQKPSDDVIPKWANSSDSSCSETENIDLRKKRILKRRPKKVLATQDLSTIFENSRDSTSPNSKNNSQNNEDGVLQDLSSSISRNIKEKCTLDNNRPPSQSSYRPSDDSDDFSEAGYTTPPPVSYAKKTWSTPERRSLKEAFSDYLNNDKLPDIRVIQNRKCSPALKDISRSLLHIQNWLRAEIQRNKKGRKGWTTPQKIKCRQYFKEYYDKSAKSVYPSLKAMRDAIDNVSEFKDKTVATLRSHLQHDFAYVNKQH